MLNTGVLLMVASKRGAALLIELKELLRGGPSGALRPIREMLSFTPPFETNIVGSAVRGAMDKLNSGRVSVAETLRDSTSSEKCLFIVLRLWLVKDRIHLAEEMGQGRPLRC